MLSRTKKLAVLFFALLTGAAAAQSLGPLRPWTVEGTAVTGRLASYRNGRATIITSSDQSVVIARDQLSPQDLLHIRGQQRLRQRAELTVARSYARQQGPRRKAARTSAPRSTGSVIPAWPIREDLYRAYNGLDIAPFSTGSSATSAYLGTGTVVGSYLILP